jgi:NAD+ synthase/NAD+ synthase (glutamine-hydrolysing)
MKSLVVTLAQINVTVGAIHGNTKQVIDIITAQASADVIIFPELTITGYPPEDLLLRPDLYPQVRAALAEIAAAAQQAAVIIGYPERVDGALYNSMAVLFQGQVLTNYRKQRLPQYGVFDEQRYFTAADQPGYFDFCGQRIGLLICEDIWHAEPLAQLIAAQVDWVAVINASPYERGKGQQRLHMLQQRSKEIQRPLLYLNLVGGQDELVFDGHSLVLDAAGSVRAELPHAAVSISSVQISKEGDVVLLSGAQQPAQSDELQQIYQALVLSIRDYVVKNGFRSVALGLSGGIDSALTLALAAEAIGASNVHAVMMPFHYTASISIDDAKTQAESLGVNYSCVPIAPIYDSFVTQLEALGAIDEHSITLQNLQARSRGVVIMALSNNTGSLVLTTGNKSELAVGYCTLYGDMCGGFAPLKDIPKMLVFALARFCNRHREIIPNRVIERAPSAELAPGQTDQDNLPDYALLDDIVERYVEQDQSVCDIVAAGYSQSDVQRVVKLIDLSEYKRRQGAVGPKISARSFAKDRRYPITNHYRYELERQLANEAKHEKN